MHEVVYKFGGTSLGSAKGIRRVYDIVSRNFPRFVVVSAIEGVTDLLEMFCSASSEYREQIIHDIENKHARILEELDLVFSLSLWLDKLRSFVDKGGLSLKERAEVLAVGEDISSALFQAFCHSNHFPMEFLEARQIILTDENYDCASPDILRMQKNWQSLNLESSICYITQGFIGSSSLGHTTLLGRGGSDYSSALIAEISGAKELCIYTDVSGVYTMDPRIIEGAQPIAELSFEEMQDLAVFGAKVLHPPMLAPCMRSGIPIFVTSTFDPSKRGTWIDAIGSREINYKTRVKALSLLQEQMLWFIECSSLGAVNLDLVMSILEEYRIIPGFITSQDTTISFVVGGMSTHTAIGDLYSKLSQIGSVQMLCDLALITMVGSGLSSTKIMTTVMDKLSNYPAPIFCCCQSDTALSIVVPNNLSESIVEQLHSDYVERKLPIVQ